MVHEDVPYMPKSRGAFFRPLYQLLGMAAGATAALSVNFNGSADLTLAFVEEKMNISLGRSHAAKVL